MDTDYPANIELMTQIGFTTRELDDNRDGHLSLKQQQKLQSVQKSWHSFSTTIKVVSPILIILSILDGVSIGDTLFSRIGIVLLICVVASAMLIYSEIKSRSLKQDLSKGTVTFVEGEVKLSQHPSKTTGIAYKIYIGRTKFELSYAVFTAFKNDQKYRIYYSPHSRTLLSAERTF